MLSKPVECQGCPLYGSGNGFVPDELISNAEVDVWLQNPGQMEELKGVPAIGATGDTLNDTLLPAAGLTRGVDVSVRNVLRCRYNGGNKLPTGQILTKAIAHCRVHDIQTTARVSVACGALAWRMWGGPGSITDWRGFPHPSKPVLATLHPADLFRNPKMKLPVLQDFAKIRKCLDGTWPEPVPYFATVKSRNDLPKLREWTGRALLDAPYVVIDTEFTRDSKYLLVIGLGYPDNEGCQIWMKDLDAVARSEVKTWLMALVDTVPVVFQNAMADMPVLKRNLGIQYHDYLRVDDTMLAHAVLWSEWPHDLGYLASLYGKYPKMKHLSTSDPELYNWGDVLDTISVWEGLRKELSRDPLSEDIYRNQSLPLIPIVLKRADRGIKVDTEMVDDLVMKYEDIRHEAELLAKAGSGYPINLGSDTQMKSYLYDFMAYPVQKDSSHKVSTGADAIANLRKYIGPLPDTDEEAQNGLTLVDALRRIDNGANPVLEARVLYSGAQQILSHFLAPLVGKDRTYPSIKIHAQASGRWSVTEPPLQQFPGDLLDVLIPNEGEVWIGWDWDQIELRILAALANDEPYLEAFTHGYDVHTLNMSELFGYPYPLDKVNPHDSKVDKDWRNEIGWVGKEDIRRVFAKRFVYRLNYGGDASKAGDIPGARQLNLDSPKLVAASKRYLSAHPAMAIWRLQVELDAKKTRVSRTFMGRRRRLLGEGQGIVREAFNHPMQGAVADILNTCTVQIADRVPYATLVYTVHDSAWWAVPTNKVTGARKEINEIICQPWTVGGVAIRIPVKWKQDRNRLAT